jgi:enamine deaminase RidA (YjgF/YER057c/UK114 family)
MKGPESEGDADPRATMRESGREIESPRFALVALIRRKAGDDGAFERFEAEAVRLMSAHGGRIERRMVCEPAGEGGPDEIHWASFPNRRAFEEYLDDPAGLARAGARSAVIESTVLYAGDEACMFSPGEPLDGSLTPVPAAAIPKATVVTRKAAYSGAPWERNVAYCRARRVGDRVFISGTCAVDDAGNAVAAGNVYEQARHALGRIRRALEELGASLDDVVRTRTYLTDMSRFDEFARAHREAFDGIDPAATCVEVSRLVAPELLVEIEADAVIARPPP